MQGIVWARLQNVVFSVFQKLPFGGISRDELKPLIIWFQQICFNKAAPCSSQVWSIGVWKTKVGRELLLMRLLWSATHPWRLGVDRLNALALLFENTAEQNKKKSIGFCLTQNIHAWLGTIPFTSAISEMHYQKKGMHELALNSSSYICHLKSKKKQNIFASCTSCINFVGFYLLTNLSYFSRTSLPITSVSMF